MVRGTPVSTSHSWFRCTEEPSAINLASWLLYRVIALGSRSSDMAWSMSGAEGWFWHGQCLCCSLLILVNLLVKACVRPFCKLDRIAYLCPRVGKNKTLAEDLRLMIWLLKAFRIAELSFKGNTKANWTKIRTMINQKWSLKMCWRKHVETKRQNRFLFAHGCGNAPNKNSEKTPNKCNFWFPVSGSCKIS